MKKILTIGFFQLGIATCALAQTFDWVKQMGGTDNDEITAITTDAAGNIYVTGKFGGTADFDPGSGVANLTSLGIFDAFVAKLTASGDLVWVKQLGGLGALGGIDIAVDDLGNVYSTGAFEGTADFDPGAAAFNMTSNGADDAYISKLDASGNFVWAKSIGGTSYDSGGEIILDALGNVVIGGAFFGSVDMDPGAAVSTFTSNGSHDIFILKLNPSGNFLTAFNLGAGSSEYISGMAVDAQNNLYLTGDYSYTVDFNPNSTPFTMSSVGSSDVFICKYDTDDFLIWAKSVGGIDQEYPQGIVLNSVGDVLVAGTFFDTCDFDPGAGVAEYVPTAGFGNAFVLSLSSNGDYNWTANVGGTHFTEGSDIGIDSDDNAYLFGIYRETMTADVNHTSNGARDIFALKLSSGGALISSYTFGGTNDDYAGAIHIDNSDNVYTVGRFSQTVDFDPGVSTSNVTSYGLSDIFIHKMGTTSNVGLMKEEQDLQASIYPNPAINFVIVQTDTKLEEVAIYSMTGALVQVEKESNFSIEKLHPGTYILHVKTVSGVHYLRLIKK